MAARSYPWTLLYDSDCGFCKWSLGWILRLDRDRRVRPLALDSPEAEHLLSDLSPDARRDSWHLVAPTLPVTPNGETRRYSAGAAAPPLLRLLPGGGVPAALLAAAPGLTERAYRLVVEHRGSFGSALPSRSRSRAEELIERRTGYRRQW